MSNKSGEGIKEVKTNACEILLKFRLDQKSDVLAGGNASMKYDEEFLKGMHVSMPKKRDNRKRNTTIP